VPHAGRRRFSTVPLQTVFLTNARQIFPTLQKKVCYMSYQNRGAFSL
jgi:hypothetical protein